MAIQDRRDLHLLAMISGGVPPGQPNPHVTKPGYEHFNVGVAVQWRRRQAQVFGTVEGPRKTAAAPL